MLCDYSLLITPDVQIEVSNTKLDIQLDKDDLENAARTQLKTRHAN